MIRSTLEKQGVPSKNNQHFEQNLYSKSETKIKLENCEEKFILVEVSQRETFVIRTGMLQFPQLSPVCANMQVLTNFSMLCWTGQCRQWSSSHMGFTNTSEHSCATCVFVRIPCESGFSLHLLCAKMLVAPLKSVSIPVLEAHRRDFGNVILFSKSSTALSWIAKPTTLWGCFIANWIAKIHSQFPASQWRHVRGPDNPTYLATHRVSTQDLLSANQWWLGQ